MTIIAPLDSRFGRVSFRLFDPGVDFPAAPSSSRMRMRTTT